jgi:chemotaxis protein methyltransferase CheR
MTLDAGASGRELSGMDFDYVRGMVRKQAGISLDDGKGYLVTSRLIPVARLEGFETVAKLVAHLRSRPPGLLHAKVVEAIATTETSFFRDHHPFEALRQHVIPELVRARRRTSQLLTLWSAACSSGQEPYTLAMILRESIPDLSAWTLQLMASDFSSAMVERARQGVYQQLEVNRGLPARMLVRYFEQRDGGWHVKDELKRMVTFFQHNLNHDWMSIPQVDLILLRNVLIYFDLDTRREILKRVRRHLKPDGYLVLGAAETTLNVDDGFNRVQFGRAVFYQRKDGGAS